MQLKRVGGSVAGDRGQTGLGWLACVRWSLAAGPLLAACAGPPASTSRPVDADGTAPVAAPRRTPETIESANPLGAQGVEEVPGDRSAGAAMLPDDVRNAEASTESGAGPDAVVQQDAAEEAAAVTESPETTDDAEARASAGSPADTIESVHAPLEPLSAVESDVLPVAQPVTGADAKLDGVLLELVRARRAGGETGLLAYVEQHRRELSLDRLQVEIVCESPGAAAAVREQVAAVGGTVTTGFENYLWAELSLEGVEALAATEAVWTVAVSQAVVRPGAR